MTFRLVTRNIIDPKICYDMWAKQQISIYRIPSILAEQGIVNGIKGKNVTPQGVWRAACLYMLEHPSIAKADTVLLYQQQGRIFDDEDFGREMVAKARQFLSPKRYRNFLSRNPEYKKYADELSQKTITQ